MDVKPISSDRKFPPGAKNYGCWSDFRYGVPSNPVQVILIIGCFSRLPTERWSFPTLQVVLSLTNHVKRRKRLKSCPTATGGGNFELIDGSLHNCDCGGVTDARCILRAMIKRGSSYRWGLPKTIANVLGIAIDDTIRRGKSVDLSQRGQVNTSPGLLSWKDR